MFKVLNKNKTMRFLCTKFCKGAVTVTQQREIVSASSHQHNENQEAMDIEKEIIRKYSEVTISQLKLIGLIRHKLKKQALKTLARLTISWQEKLFISEICTTKIRLK